MNVQFEYSLGEPVKIKALENMLGHIDSLELDNNGKMYRVIYWFNGERKSAWSYGHELESTESKTDINAKRLHWLHDCSSGQTDAEGYEWGIYRVKWENGRAVDVLATLADFSDLDAEMERELHTSSNPSLQGTGHLVGRTLQGVVRLGNQKEE